MITDHELDNYLGRSLWVSKYLARNRNRFRVLCNCWGEELADVHDLLCNMDQTPLTMWKEEIENEGNIMVLIYSFSLLDVTKQESKECIYCSVNLT